MFKTFYFCVIGRINKYTMKSEIMEATNHIVFQHCLSYYFLKNRIGQTLLRYLQFNCLINIDTRDCHLQRADDGSCTAPKLSRGQE